MGIRQPSGSHHDPRARQERRRPPVRQSLTGLPGEHFQTGRFIATQGGRALESRCAASAAVAARGPGCSRRRVRRRHKPPAKAPVPPVPGEAMCPNRLPWPGSHDGCLACPAWPARREPCSPRLLMPPIRRIRVRVVGRGRRPDPDRWEETAWASARCLLARPARRERGDDGLYQHAGPISLAPRHPEPRLTQQQPSSPRFPIIARPRSGRGKEDVRLEQGEQQENCCWMVGVGPTVDRPQRSAQPLTSIPKQLKRVADTPQAGRGGAIVVPDSLASHLAQPLCEMRRSRTKCAFEVPSPRLCGERIEVRGCAGLSRIESLHSSRSTEAGDRGIRMTGDCAP
jgi:hypothetical protein